MKYNLKGPMKLIQQFHAVLEHKQILPSMGETQQRLAEECRKTLEAPHGDAQFLQELCEALGWQGGTIWQVMDEVRRLKAEERRLKEYNAMGQHLDKCFGGHRP